MSLTPMVMAWKADLPATEKLVYLALADHAWDDGSHVYPSIDYVAYKTSLTARTVQIAMRKLEARGILIAVAWLQGGRGHATMYRIDMLAIPMKPPYGPIEEYTQPEGEKGAGDSPIVRKTVKGESDDIKGESDSRKTVKGESDDIKGEGDSPEPLSNPKDINHKNNHARATHFENQKQKPETAERPRSQPATLDTPRAIETSARTAQTPPPPTPSAPAGDDYGVERFMYWQQVRSLIEPRFGGGFMRNYFDAAKLYERAPGDYVIVCRTPMVQEQLLIRARAEIVLQLAAVVRSHVELEIITQKRIAAPVAAYAEVKHA